MSVPLWVEILMLVLCALFSVAALLGTFGLLFHLLALYP